MSDICVGFPPVKLPQCLLTHLPRVDGHCFKSQFRHFIICVVCAPQRLWIPRSKMWTWRCKNLYENSQTINKLLGCMSPVLTYVVWCHLSFAETPWMAPKGTIFFGGIISTKLLLWVQEISFPLSTFTLNGAFNKKRSPNASLMLRCACFWREPAESTKWQNNGPRASSQGRACTLLWPCSGGEACGKIQVRRLSRQTETLEADLELSGHGWILLKLAMEEISCRKIHKDKRIQTESWETQPFNFETEEGGAQNTGVERTMKD